MTRILAAVLLCGIAMPSAQAALVDKGGGMIYDTVLNVTWLQDANYAKTSGHEADGRMNWDNAVAWADNLVHAGYGDWRLPTALNQDASGPCGPAYNCSSSEMGHMFYNNMGAIVGQSILSGSNAANLALFSNLQSLVYWSGTAYAPNPTNAWNFNTNNGNQNNNDKNNEFYAWAVRPGG